MLGGSAPRISVATRPAFREHDLKGDSVGSISNERTFRADVAETTTIESQLCSLCERVCWAGAAA